MFRSSKPLIFPIVNLHDNVSDQPSTRQAVRLELIRLIQVARRPNRSTSITFDVDLLIGWMMSTFRGEPTREEVVHIFNTIKIKTIDDLTTEVFESMEAECIPIFVAKVILGSFKLPVNTREMIHWKEFVRRYAPCLPNM